MAAEPQSNSSTVRELLMWCVAGVAMPAVAVLSIAAGRGLLGWTESEWIVGSLAVGLASLTWGSWASLLWTRSRVLQTLMVAVVVIPGVVMVLVGGWAFFNVPDNPWVWRWGWLIVCGHGLGALAVAVLVCARRLLGGVGDASLRSRRMVLGWTVFPGLMAACGVGIAAVVFTLMPDLFADTETGVAQVVRWVVPSQALLLLSTVLPAGIAELCDRLTASGSQ